MLYKFHVPQFKKKVRSLFEIFARHECNVTWRWSVRGCATVPRQQTSEKVSDVRCYSIEAIQCEAGAAIESTCPTLRPGRTTIVWLHRQAAHGNASLSPLMTTRDLG